MSPGVSEGSEKLGATSPTPTSDPDLRARTRIRAGADEEEEKDDDGGGGGDLRADQKRTQTTGTARIR